APFLSSGAGPLSACGSIPASRSRSVFFLGLGIRFQVAKSPCPIFWILPAFFHVLSPCLPVTLRHLTPGSPISSRGEINEPSARCRKRLDPIALSLTGSSVALDNLQDVPLRHDSLSEELANPAANAPRLPAPCGMNMHLEPPAWVYRFAHIADFLRARVAE